MNHGYHPHDGIAPRRAARNIAVDSFVTAMERVRDEAKCHEGHFIFSCFPFDSPSFSIVSSFFRDRFLVFPIFGPSSAQAADEVGT